MKIDFVVLWVDGSDIDWQKQKEQYTGIPSDANDIRYRDWGCFKYWFRAVETYAPWVNRVFLITCGQVPKWLNTTHPKLRLINHKDYIPSEYLPTFSANPIELNLHRIPELSEYFVYFNDDIFLNGPSTAEDFFFRGVPRLSAILNVFAPSVVNDTFQHCLCNDIAFMNTHFNKRRVIRNNLGKWFSLEYGMHLLKNIYYAFGSNHFSMIQNFHMCSPMLKSTYEKVWLLEPELLHETSLHKTRNHKDVNQYIMSYYDIASGNFVPRNPQMGRYYEIGRNSETLCSDILQGSHKMICINDSPCDNFEFEIQKVIAAFEKKFPQKSMYEM